MVCSNCGGSYKVAMCTPDMDIEPVPLCVICVVMGFDWEQRLGVRSRSQARRIAHQLGDGPSGG